MSGTLARLGLLGRVRARLNRRQAEHSVRESIAELVQEAAKAAHVPGGTPELDRHERALINNVLRLRETTARDVMVPRTDIVAIRLDTGFQAAVEQIRAEGHSRLPVYREQLDDVLGMVHIKDVYAFLGHPEDFSLEKILRRPLMVAPQMPVLDLLLQMRQARMHLALVVDEYGGIDGALDLTARLPVAEFEKRLGPVLTPEEREADINTVGGLVFTLAGRVPARGEVVSHPGGIEFQVLDADPRRIRRLRVRRSQAERQEAA